MQELKYGAIAARVDFAAGSHRNVDGEAGLCSFPRSDRRRSEGVATSHDQWRFEIGGTMESRANEPTG